MKKMMSTMLMLVLVLSMALTGCGMDAKDVDSSQASTEVSQESSESVETEESTEESSVETESTVESETTTEELSEVEVQAAAIAEELELDEELSAMLLEELQMVWEAYEGDSEQFLAYVDIAKEEYANMKEGASEETTGAETPSIEINWVEENLPTDRAWVDNLYNELIEKDYQAVIELLYADDIMTNAEPYAYVEYTYDAIGYKLVTSDGKYVGLILSNDGVSKDVWYSENAETDYGFTYTQNGDIVVSTWDAGTGTRDYRWFDGKTIRDSYGSESTLEDGEAFSVWAM